MEGSTISLFPFQSSVAPAEGTPSHLSPDSSPKPILPLRIGCSLKPPTLGKKEEKTPWQLKIVKWQPTGSPSPAHLGRPDTPWRPVETIAKLSSVPLASIPPSIRRPLTVEKECCHRRSMLITCPMRGSNARHKQKRNAMMMGVWSQEGGQANLEHATRRRSAAINGQRSQGSVPSGFHGKRLAFR